MLVVFAYANTPAVKPLAVEGELRVSSLYAETVSITSSSNIIISNSGSAISSTVPTSC